MKIAGVLVCLVACGGDPFTAADVAGGASEGSALPVVDAGDGVDVVDGSPASLVDRLKARDGAATPLRDASADVAGEVVAHVDASADAGPLCCVAQCPNPHPEPRCPGYVAACLVPCP